MSQMPSLTNLLLEKNTQGGGGVVCVSGGAGSRASRDRVNMKDHTHMPKEEYPMAKP